MICYEVAFDHLVRSEVNAGANLLAVQSNDADFEIDGQLGETEQQTAMARIRAVESDRALVYASTTGESTIIAPDGSLIAHSGVWQQAILDARVPLVSYRTLASRVGAWPEYLIILLTVLALAWAVVRATRRGVRRLNRRGTIRVFRLHCASKLRHVARRGKRRVTVRGTDRRPGRRARRYAGSRGGGHRPAGHRVQQRQPLHRLPRPIEPRPPRRPRRTPRRWPGT